NTQTDFNNDSLIQYINSIDDDEEDDDWDEDEWDEYSAEPVVIESPLKTDPHYIYSGIQDKNKLDEQYWKKKKDEYRYVEETKVQNEQKQVKSNPFDFNKAWLKYLIYGIGISLLLFVIVFL